MEQYFPYGFQLNQDPVTSWTIPLAVVMIVAAAYIIVSNSKLIYRVVSVLAILMNLIVITTNTFYVANFPLTDETGTNLWWLFNGAIIVIAITESMLWKKYRKKEDVLLPK